MNILSAFAGNAGEYFVAGQLLRLGWHAALTARGSRAYDVLAQRDDLAVALRVKTKTAAARAFQWSCKKTGEIFLDLRSRGDFTVLVDLPKAIVVGPTFYVVPTTVINDWLTESHRQWLATPGAKGQAHVDNPRRAILVDSAPGIGHGGPLQPYRDAWHLLEEGSAQ